MESSYSANPLDTVYSAAAQTMELGPAPQAPAPMPATAPPAVQSAPFDTQQNLLSYAKILGMPVGVAGSLLGGVVCKDDLCSRGAILTVAAAVGYYGYTRKDIIGWALVVSAASAAVFTLFDAPRVTALPGSGLTQ